MITLTAIGLGADLVGVLILGFDVASIQASLRAGAIRSRELLDEALGPHGGIEYLKRGSDWRSGTFTEGLFEPDGGFDHQAAERSFNELVDTVASVGDSTDVALSYLVKSVAEQEKTASKSLTLTYVGLTLIVVGFSLQLLSLVLG